MKVMAAVGVLIGGACSLLAWARDVPGRLSVFPDALSFLVPALLVAVTLRIVSATRRPTRAALRRAGSALIGTGALSFATGSGLLRGTAPTESTVLRRIVVPFSCVRSIKGMPMLKKRWKALSASC